MKVTNDQLEALLRQQSQTPSTTRAQTAQGGFEAALSEQMGLENAVASSAFPTAAAGQTSQASMFGKQRAEIFPSGAVASQGGPDKPGRPARARRLNSLPGLEWEALAGKLVKGSRILEQETTLAVPGIKTLTISLGGAAMSTLRSKTGFFLVSPEKCVFCKFTQHQPSPSHSLRRV